MSNDLHSAEERCFYCATDRELTAAISGPESRVIRMDTGPQHCPTWIDDQESATPRDVQRFQLAPDTPAPAPPTRGAETQESR